MSHTRMIDDTTDLVHDVEDQSWYFQRYGGQNGELVTSASYDTEEDALEAWDEGRVIWEF